MATTINYSWNLPTVGGNQDTWGELLNDNWTALDTLLGGVNATEVSILDGATVTTAELNKLDGVTWTLTDFNALTATVAELNILDGVTATAAELNKVDGFTGDALDLNYAKDLRATGVTATEFDYLDGVTSAIQTQINAKAPVANPTFTGAATIPTANITTANITTSNVTTANLTTANITTVDLGNWTITESAGVLYFATGGVRKMKLDASGNLTVTGDVTAYGTV